MFTHYKKMLLAPIALYNLGAGGGEVPGVDEKNSLDEISEKSGEQIIQRLNTIAEEFKNNGKEDKAKEVILKLNEVHSATLEDKNTVLLQIVATEYSLAHPDQRDGVFETTTLSGEKFKSLEFDADDSWIDESALSKEAMAILRKQGLTNNQIVAGFNTELKNLSQEEVRIEANAKAHKEYGESRMASEKASKQALKEAKNRANEFADAGKFITEQAAEKEEQENRANEFADAGNFLTKQVEKKEELQGQANTARLSLQSYLNSNDGKIKFSEVKGNPKMTKSVQTILLAELGIEKIKEVTGRNDMTKEKFIDGDYGSWTMAAAKELQAGKKGLTVDGLVGQNTIIAMLNDDSIDNGIYVATK